LERILGGVDFDLKFTYVLASWKESAHDASILAESLSSIEEFNIPDGNFYLEDAEYRCRHGILPHFKKRRYHLNESLQ
jgi:hypothetical protein